MVLFERLECHTDRQPALQLWHQIGRLGQVKGTGSNEEYVVSAYCRREVSTA
jgi:hypothetical protein